MLISTFFITISHPTKYKLIMIFYFSCTGNTRWAAHKIAEATGDTLIDIAAELKKLTRKTLRTRSGLSTTPCLLTKASHSAFPYTDGVRHWL